MEGAPRKLDGEKMRKNEGELRNDTRSTYLMRSGKLSLVVFVDEAFVEQRHQGICVDVRGKFKLPVRLVHPPLFLQLGGRLSIICSGQSHLNPGPALTRAGSRAAAGSSERARLAAVHILDSSRYLDSK
jgi:hypothetical protein